MGLILLGVIHGIVLLVGVAVSLLLPAQITSPLVISLVFSAIAYLAFAASTMYAAWQSKEKAMQNGGIIIAAILYLVAALIASVVFAVLKLSTKIHILLEMILMAAGVIMLIMMIMAKRYIDSQMKEQDK